MLSFEDFAKTKGIALENLTSQERSSLMVLYRKHYQRSYQKTYQTKKRRVQVVFEKSEYQELQKAAKAHNQKLTTFVRNSSLAYLNECYLLPDDTQVRALEIGLRRIGNNVNQLSRRSNSGLFKMFDAKSAKSLIQQLEIQVQKALRTPPSLKEELTREIQSNPQLLLYLKNLISKLESK